MEKSGGTRQRYGGMGSKRLECCSPQLKLGMGQFSLFGKKIFKFVAKRSSKMVCLDCI